MKNQSHEVSLTPELDAIIVEMAKEAESVGKKKKKESSSTGWTGSSSYVSCSHNKPVAVFKDEKSGAVVWAGSETQIAHNLDIIKPALVVSLNGNRLKQEPIVEMNDAALAVLPDNLKAFASAIEIPNIVVDWPDRGLPPVDLSFWKALAEYFKAGNTIAMHCMAGHGRTGTGLALLMQACGYGGDHVEFIRKHYCTKTVESDKQIEYLKKAGVETKAKPSDSSSFSGQTNFGGFHKGTSFHHGSWMDDADVYPAKDSKYEYVKDEKTGQYVPKKDTKEEAKKLDKKYHEMTQTEWDALWKELEDEEKQEGKVDPSTRGKRMRDKMKKALKD